MKKLLLLLLTFTSISLFAQKNKVPNEAFYLFNAKDEPVKTLGAASTFEVVSKENDTSYMVCYYKNYGSMLWLKTFKDSSLTIPNGRFVWYDIDGYLDSTGCMKDGKRNGEWMYMDSAQKSQIVSTKEKVRKIGKNAFQLLPNIHCTYQFYKLGNEEPDIKNVINTIDYSKEQTKEWLRYWRKNLDQHLGKLNSIYGLSGNVASEEISFFVNKNGEIEDAYLLHSSGFPYDKEVMQKVKNAKGIVPFKKNQLIIGYRENQNILFNFQY